MPLSPGSVPSRLSPRSPISPNINPFAPLSPDLPHAHLVNMPSMHQADQRRSLRTYTRQSLLHIAKRCKRQGWTKPAGMAELGSWYGPMTGGSRHTHDDPAIASIDPAPSTSANRRNGPVGFGEGFGFGGGIGSGRGIGKSGRSIGSRTTEAPAEASEAGSSRRPQNAMGRFALRGNGDRAGPSEPTKHGSDRNLRRDDGEWRRPAHNTNETHKRNGPNWSHRPAYEDDSVEPAWMADDSAPAALQAGSELSDSRHSNPLSPPGFDAPAPFRFRGDDSRRPEKTLVSFFDTLEGSSNQPPPMPAYPVQVKTFNAADYLKSAQNAAEVQEPAQPAGGFSSRFQKFFGSGAASDPVAANANFATTSSVSSPNPITSPPPESATHKADDHMAKLMGMLSTRPTPAPEYSPTDRQRGEAVSLPVQDHHYQPYPTSAYGFPNQSRIESQPSSTSGHQNFTSPPPQALYHQSPATVHRSDLPAPYGGYQGGFPANSQQHPNLAPVNHPASFAPVNPAPQFAPNGPGRASPQDLLRHLQRVPPGPPGGQYYAPPPPGQFPQYLEHEAQSAGNHHVYHQQNPPFMQQRSDSGNRFVPPHHLAEYDQKGPPAIFPNPGNPPSRNLNMAQQDMLAALFAGLPGSSHPNQ